MSRIQKARPAVEATRSLWVRCTVRSVIAAAGMFFRVRLVIFTTVVTVLSFGALAWTRPQEIEQLHYGVIYAGRM